MANCSNCGRSFEGEPKICPHCGWKTRLGSSGMSGAGNLSFLVAALMIGIVLVAMLYPVFRSAKETALKLDHMSQARLVGTAVSLYVSDHDDKFPFLSSAPEIAASLRRYMPSQPTKGDLTNLASSYDWNQDLSGINESDIDNPPKTLLFHSNKPVVGDIYVLCFADSMVATRREYLLPSILAVKPSRTRSPDMKVKPSR